VVIRLASYILGYVLQDYKADCQFRWAKRFIDFVAGTVNMAISLTIEELE